MSTSTTPDGEQPKTTETAVEVTQQFLNTTSDYFQSEMKLAASDYECLSKMNAASFDKYKHMQLTLGRVNNSIRSMNESNRSNVLSTNTQFEDIEEAVTDLESTIKNLDAYSRSLESQVKKFEKQSATNRNKASKKD